MSTKRQTIVTFCNFPKPLVWWPEKVTTIPVVQFSRCNFALNLRLYKHFTRTFPTVLFVEMLNIFAFFLYLMHSYWYPDLRQALHVWVHITHSSCQTILSCRRLHPLTFELRQRWQLDRGARSAVLGRALGSPLPLGLPHGLSGEAIHFLGCGDGRHFWCTKKLPRSWNDLVYT